MNHRKTSRSLLATTLLALAFITTGQSYASDNVVPLTGLWYNEGCSTMNITQALDTGTLSGSYSNGEAGWCAQSDDWYPLTGYAVGSEINFAVNWTKGPINCNSITTWTGNIEDTSQGPVIHTSWVLTPTGNGKIYTGNDVFTRSCTCGGSCPAPASKK